MYRKQSDYKNLPEDILNKVKDGMDEAAARWDVQRGECNTRWGNKGIEGHTMTQYRVIPCFSNLRTLVTFLDLVTSSLVQNYLVLNVWSVYLTSVTFDFQS